MGRKIRELRTLEVGYWAFLFVIVILAHLFVAYIPLAHTSQYTYFQDQTAPSATVFSERWSLQWWFAGSPILLWAVTFSAAFMLAYYRSNWPKIFHIMLTTLVLIWFLVMVGFGIFYWINANDPTIPDNPANSLKYCCVFGASHVECPNNPSGSVCPFAIGPNDLTVNSDFFIDFWFKTVFVVFLIIDIILAGLYMRWSRRSIEVERGEGQIRTIVVTERTRGGDRLQVISNPIQEEKASGGSYLKSATKRSFKFV